MKLIQNLRDQWVAASGTFDHGVHVPGRSLARVVCRSHLWHDHDHDDANDKFDDDDDDDDDDDEDKVIYDDDLKFIHHLAKDGVETTVERPREGGGESLDHHCHHLHHCGHCDHDADG